jgi:hypothetical protein
MAKSGHIFAQTLYSHFGSVMPIVTRLLYVDVWTWARFVRGRTGGNCGGGGARGGGGGNTH